MLVGVVVAAHVLVVLVTILATILFLLEFRFFILTVDTLLELRGKLHTVEFTFLTLLDLFTDVVFILDHRSLVLLRFFDLHLNVWERINIDCKLWLPAECESVSFPPELFDLPCRNLGWAEGEGIVAVLVGGQVQSILSHD